MAPSLDFTRDLSCDVATAVSEAVRQLSPPRATAARHPDGGDRLVGGQLTSQVVPPDEHAWIESLGETRSYREYRDRVRDYTGIMIRSLRPRADGMSGIVVTAVSRA